MSGSNSGNTTKDWRDLTSTDRRQLYGSIRHMAVTLTSKSFWQTLGHLLLDNTTKETADAEVYSGIGFYSRPPADANAEAILAFPGGASNPAIVALRDEATRKKVAGGAQQDETWVYNTQVALRLSNSGLIQAFLVGGPTPVPLALLSDVQVLTTAYNAHQHVGVTAGPSNSGAPTPTSIAPPPVGSSVLRG